jgi:hypothetical protein
VKASFEYKARLLKLKNQIRDRGGHDQLMAYGFLRDRTRLQVCDAVKYRLKTYCIQGNYEYVLARASRGIARVIESLGLTPNLVDILDWVTHGDLTSRQIQSPAMTSMRSALLEWRVEYRMRHESVVGVHQARARLDDARARDVSLVADAESNLIESQRALDKQEARIAQARERYEACRNTVKSL